MLILRCVSHNLQYVFKIICIATSKTWSSITCKWGQITIFEIRNTWQHLNVMTATCLKEAYGMDTFLIVYTFSLCCHKESDR